MTEDSDPRWLRGDEPAAWLDLVGLMLRLPAALDRQLREDAGIPHAYWMVLAMLSQAPDHTLRMSELARLTSTSPSRLSHAVASLERRGWVQRRPSPQDGRGQLAALTEDGVRTLEQVAPGHVAEVRRLVFDPLDARDVADLRRVLGKVLAAVDEAQDPDGQRR